MKTQTQLRYVKRPCRNGTIQIYMPKLQTVTKVKIILAVCLILCPLSLLLVMEGLSPTELGNMLAGWIALGFISLIPLSHMCASFFALHEVRDLNVLCDQMKSGNLTPFDTLPPEPAGHDPLQTLRHNMFWIGHIIDSRQKALNGAMENLHVAQSQLVESIEYASLIQSAFLPAEKVLHDLFADYFLLWDQRDAVGGDAYWVKKLEGGFFVAVVDCTGHGVPGAFMTLIVHSLFEQLDVESMRGDPARVLSSMNRLIKRSLAQDRDDPLSDDGMDCSVIYVDSVEQTLHFAGARSSLFVQNSTGVVREIKGDKCGVGYVRSELGYAFTNHVLQVEKGSRYYCLSDGLTDQVGGDRGFPFGKRRFCEFVERHGTIPLAQQKPLLQSALRDYMGRQTRRDDITVLGFAMHTR